MKKIVLGLALAVACASSFAAGDVQYLNKQQIGKLWDDRAYKGKDRFAPFLEPEYDTTGACNDLLNMHFSDRDSLNPEQQKQASYCLGLADAANAMASAELRREMLKSTKHDVVCVMRRMEIQADVPGFIDNEDQPNSKLVIDYVNRVKADTVKKAMTACRVYSK